MGLLYFIYWFICIRGLPISRVSIP